MWKQTKRPEPTRSQNRMKNLPKSTKAFDVETGQVYSESQVRIGPRHHSDWIGELKTPSLVKASQPGLTGARTLMAMAKTCMVRQLRSLDQEHLTTVPWTIAQALWEEIVTSRRESFHAWRIFAQSYPSLSEFGSPRYRYHLQIKQPPLALEDYLRGITSERLEWMTCLRISPKENRVTDLVSLANIANLAVLDLSDGQVAIDTKSSSFDERVMRTWAELARGEGKLRHLQVLLLGWQEHVSSSWLFKYLSNFPLLRQVIITDCPKIHQKNRKDWEPIALEHGWEARRAKRSAKSLRPILNEQDFQLGAVSGALFSNSEVSKSSVTKPVLECWLGTPRTWTHILDDFPSTRTIVFDRTEQQLPKSDVGEGSSNNDPTKRARNHEQRSVEVRSPPPKRASKPFVKLNPALRGASDLLAGFNDS